MIDANNKQRNVLIAFRNLYEDHTKASQASVIASVLKSYKISEKLHCFVGNNTSSIDNETIAALNKHLDLNLDLSHRIHCVGHIINLVVKATIYGKRVSKFEERFAAATPLDQFKLGAVSKLHNFVNAVCASHKRREAFHDMQKQYNKEELIYNFISLQLMQDGSVRWQSVYLMLLCCREFREVIKRFIQKLWPDNNNNNSSNTNASVTNKYDPMANKLTDEEWDEVEKLVNFLQALYEMTKRLEGNLSSSGFGSIWQILINLQALGAMYTNQIERPHNKFIVAAIKFGRKKLYTYFNKLLMQPKVSFYAVALTLHPKLCFM
jgi:hypothetical protein